MSEKVCALCGSKGKLDPMRNSNGSFDYLCKVCGGTFIGWTLLYPKNYFEAERLRQSGSHNY